MLSQQCNATEFAPLTRTTSAQRTRGAAPVMATPLAAAAATAVFTAAAAGAIIGAIAG
ncbi:MULTISPECIES: hypothetical protein [Curtobacterium]|uniref:hypothetical protein n=1 Tax=Curtobacterium TaxID=2034 RepID=UPI0026581F5C|nr:hypothetical protein [Curtobacterium flaccumfaciens]MCS5518604.1 hypothetical protein [Curtobacterium flaccumfaciens]